MPITIARTVSELRAARARHRQSAERFAYVPTMGALHDGHISLIYIGKNCCERVGASIFVNPKQFGPNEDFSRYPRTEKEDVEKLEAAGADVVFIPAVEEMYPAGASTSVSVAGLTDMLCGASRPGHFDGVATVVAKLLLQAMPEVAIFGEKDYQQLQVIRRMARDLDIPAEIVGAPIAREADGLAMSSRNRYLSAEERKVAPLLYRMLGELAKQPSPAQGLSAAREALVKQGFTKVDYLEWRDAETLHPAADRSRPSRLFAAVFLGKTRLIDNLAL
ncbi:MAG: pantoate--beta-alanine ligase [Alphaproteobacteria bacterium]|nr:pantoate--beta-alanine ligase [Alphaproteobacteria bacterium]